MTVTQESCLECHSTPDIAPISQVATYGDEGGYNWQLGEVIAAQTIYVPAGDILSEAGLLLTSILSVVLITFVGIGYSVNWFIKRSVVSPINDLNSLTVAIANDTVTVEQIESPELIALAQREDELGQLTRTFQQMAREVRQREQDLIKARDEAVEAQRIALESNRLKSEFLAMMSPMSYVHR